MCQKFGKCLTGLCWHVSLPLNKIKTILYPPLPPPLDHPDQQHSMWQQGGWTWSRGPSDISVTQHSHFMLFPKGCEPWGMVKLTHALCILGYTTYLLPSDDILLCWQVPAAYSRLHPVHKDFICEAILENVLLPPLHSPKPVLKHTPFPHVFWRLWRLLKSIALLLDFSKVQRIH